MTTEAKNELRRIVSNLDNETIISKRDEYYKKSSMTQSGDHYGHKDGDTIGITIIDKPQFSARHEWNTKDEAIAALNNPNGLSITFDLFGRDTNIDYRLYL